MAPGLPLLTCDLEQISKMLFNLLMNAIQASPGGGQIVIAGNVDGDSIVISIKDQGRGIAPTIAGRIFDPFFTNRENALGLGLTVARQIVNSHCGNITVMESTDRGTLVSVRLPLTPPDPHEYRPHSGG
jgi:signal transduction histidine kinase